MTTETQRKAPARDPLSRAAAERGLDMTPLGVAIGGLVIGGFYPDEARAAESLEGRAPPLGRAETHGAAQSGSDARTPTPAGDVDSGGETKSHEDMSVKIVSLQNASGTAAGGSHTGADVRFDSGHHAPVSHEFAVENTFQPAADWENADVNQSGGARESGSTENALAPASVNYHFTSVASPSGDHALDAPTSDTDASAIPTSVSAPLIAVTLPVEAIAPVVTTLENVADHLASTTDGLATVIDGIAPAIAPLSSPVLATPAETVLHAAATATEAVVAPAAAIVSTVEAAVEPVIHALETQLNHPATIASDVAHFDLPLLHLGFLGQSYADLGVGDLGPPHDQGLLHGLL